MGCSSPITVTVQVPAYTLSQSSTSTPGNIQISGVTPGQNIPGNFATVIVVLTNTGGSVASVVVSGDIFQIVNGWNGTTDYTIVNFVPQSVDLNAGSSVTITLTSAAVIPDSVANMSLMAQVSLSTGASTQIVFLIAAVPNSPQALLCYGSPVTNQDGTYNLPSGWPANWYEIGLTGYYESINPNIIPGTNYVTGNLAGFGPWTVSWIPGHGYYSCGKRISVAQLQQLGIYTDAWPGYPGTGY